jgi:hypothetical protein
MFYEYLFDLNNMSQIGKENSFFSISNTNFNFSSNTFGPGPLITNSPIHYINKNNVLSTTVSGISINGTDLIKASVQNDKTYLPSYIPNVSQY